MASGFLNCNRSRQNPRTARKRRRGRFTDKGTPEVIPGRKAKASVKAKGKRSKAKVKNKQTEFLPFNFCLLPFAFTEDVWLPK